ncbi:hypothetical protein RLIN73S_02077 [Rhodanobacter lindaniclasticus]
MVIVGVMGILNVAPWEAVIVLIVITTVLACLVAQHEWGQVRMLARLMAGWNDAKSDPETFHPAHLPRHTDADVASLARGLHGFATRLADYDQRERNFTRDASHELRSPLTVIRMSVDMLAEEEGLSEFGAHFGVPDQAGIARTGDAGGGAVGAGARRRHAGGYRALRGE